MRFTEETERFADRRQISNEVAEAILEMRKTEAGAHRIWEDPTAREERAVMARAWEIADPATTELYWGGTHRRPNAPPAKDALRAPA